MGAPVSEKTEQPSAKRLREARRKGQFPRSRLLASASATLGGLLGLVFALPTANARLQSWTTELMLRTDASVSTAAITEGLIVSLLLCGPPLAGALLGAAAAAVTFAGFQFQFDQAAPQLERIDPIGGMKKVFSLRQLAEVGRALLVGAVIAKIVWGDLTKAANEAFRASWLDGDAAVIAILLLLEPVAVKCAAVLVVLGIGDYLLARRRHIKDQMMSKEEVKREYKESEGDPHHKGQRKALHRSLAQGGPARGLQKATAVVVNPTHIAVALRYDEAECDAPYLVAKGREEDALAIRLEAKRLGIPVVKDIPLARSLINFDVGEEIPEELYRAAAAVLQTALEGQKRDPSPRRETS